MKIWTRIATVTVGTGCALVMAVTPALAGEVGGNGKDLPLKGRSICKYSGLNDERTADDPSRTQSYGTLVSQFGKEALAAMNVPSPGLACNPNNEPPPEG